MNLNRLAELFLEELSQTRNKTTMESYTKRLERFLTFCESRQIQEAAELTGQTLLHYQAELERVQMATNSRHVYLAAAKSFCHYLFNRDYLLFNPAQGFALPQWERATPKRMSPKQLEKMFSRMTEAGALSDRNKAILSLHCSDRLSTGDLEGLSVLDVNLGFQELRLGKKKRFKVIGEKSTAWLKSYLKTRPTLHPKTDWLFIKEGGGKLSQQGINVIIRNAVRGKQSKTDGNKQKQAKINENK